MVNPHITGGVLRTYINGVMFSLFHLSSSCCRFSPSLIAYFNFSDKWHWASISFKTTVHTIPVSKIAPPTKNYWESQKLTQAKEARLPIAVATPPAITALATSIEKSPRKLTRSRSELIINSMVLQATENQIQNLTPFIDSDKAPRQPIASSRTWGAREEKIYLPSFSKSQGLDVVIFI